MRLRCLRLLKLVQVVRLLVHSGADRRLLLFLMKRVMYRLIRRWHRWKLIVLMAETILGFPERRLAVVLSVIKTFFCSTPYRSNRRVSRS